MDTDTVQVLTRLQARLRSKRFQVRVDIKAGVYVPLNQLLPGFFQGRACTLIELIARNEACKVLFGCHPDLAKPESVATRVLKDLATPPRLR